MTLPPETRVVLTEALRPPAGFRVDLAVGTTYSLDLTALLLAPLAFALSDEWDLEHTDPIRLLDAMRRHADHTTVFSQAGGIHVPGSYRRILALVEDAVIEVTAPTPDGIFHPKVWALRFEDKEGAHLHRVVVQSRNLTFDQSWDTALVLDESPDGTIDAAPAAEFLTSLPRLALRPLSPARAAQVAELAGTLSTVRLAPPAPFTSGELVPIGLRDAPTWPFPESGERLLAISPFLTKGSVRELAKVAQQRVLVSRSESIDAVGADTLASWSTYVLQPMAETDPEQVESADDGGTEVLGRDGFLERGDGLHAKTFVIDVGGRESVTVTGSANLTGAAWRTNIEFDAVLRGPTSACGVDATLDGPKEAPGLMQVLEEYVPTQDSALDDEEYEAARVLELFHHRLAAGTPTLDIAVVDEDRVTATLTLEVPTNAPGTTRMWLASLPDGAHAREFAETAQWTLAHEHVTPFVAVETTSGPVTRRCVLKAELRGEIDERRKDAVMSVLKDPRDVLRYLAFLLGDPTYDTLLTQMTGDGSGGGQWGASPGGSGGIALFEPLVRAAGRDPEALAQVARLVADLKAMPGGEELVPEGFEDLWDAVWQAHEEQRP